MGWASYLGLLPCRLPVARAGDPVADGTGPHHRLRPPRDTGRPRRDHRRRCPLRGRSPGGQLVCVPATVTLPRTHREIDLAWCHALQPRVTHPTIQRHAAERRDRAEPARARQREHVEAAREDHGAGDEQPARLSSPPPEARTRQQRGDTAPQPVHEVVLDAGLVDGEEIGRQPVCGGRARRMRRAPTPAAIRRHAVTSNVDEAGRSGIMYASRSQQEPHRRRAQQRAVDCQHGRDAEGRDEAPLTRLPSGIPPRNAIM